MYGASYRVKSDITIADLMAHTQHVVVREVEVIRSQLLRNHVDLLGGTARFEGPHTVTVCGDARGDHTTITAEKIVIATGTKPARPAKVEFDDDHVLDFRRRAADAVDTPFDGRRRGRRDRHRVRADVRGTQYPGDRCREAPADAGVLRP
jgi:pyruvate/2-oxoglutarate dehydrogenase complex dihydrolipoamide dehydrogenase (E3) component